MIEKEVLDKLTSLAITKDELKVLERELNSYRVKIEIHKEKLALQAACFPHDWHYEGHSHSDDYYVCRKCGLDKFA